MVKCVAILLAHCLFAQDTYYIHIYFYIFLIMSILWNAVTSPETFLNGNSVKRILHKDPSPILRCIS